MIYSPFPRYKVHSVVRLKALLPARSAVARAALYIPVAGKRGLTREHRAGARCRDATGDARVRIVPAQFMGRGKFARRHQSEMIVLVISEEHGSLVRHFDVDVETAGPRDAQRGGIERARRRERTRGVHRAIAGVQRWIGVQELERGVQVGAVEKDILLIDGSGVIEEDDE